MGCTATKADNKVQPSQTYDIISDNAEKEKDNKKQTNRNALINKINSTNNKKNKSLTNGIGSDRKRISDTNTKKVETSVDSSENNKKKELDTLGTNGNKIITAENNRGKSNVSAQEEKSVTQNKTQQNRSTLTKSSTDDKKPLSAEHSELLLNDDETSSSNLIKKCSREGTDSSEIGKNELNDESREVQVNYVKSGTSNEAKDKNESNKGDGSPNPVDVQASYVGSGESRTTKTNTRIVSTNASYVGSDKTDIKKTTESSKSPLPLSNSATANDSVDDKTTDNKLAKHEDKTNAKEQKVADGKTESSTEVADELKAVYDDKSGPAPTLVKAKDIMPNADTLKVLADQVRKSPIALKPTLGSLVKRLTKPAATDLEKIWAFYRWIVINIKYDVDGYFGDAPKKPSDPVSVLKNGFACCEGYTNLVLAFCEKANIVARTINGYSKPYGYSTGEDVSKSETCKHSWNAVLIDQKWFLLDCTWGAGFVKRKDKQYVRWPNDFYFFTDPGVFISDHFPMMDNDYEKSCKWQLLEMPITLEMFIRRVNMDQPGKEWGIQTHHHPYATIDVQNEDEIMVQESHTPMLDYMVHMRNDNFQLMDKYTFAYKYDTQTFKVHVRPPIIGEYMCQIYGRREIDGRDAHFQPLVLYKIHCTEVYDRPREFPRTDAKFGPVPDIKRFGFSHTGNVLYKAEFGEVSILLNPTAEACIVPRLYIGDTEFDYLLEHCLIQYSEDFRHVTVSLRLPYEGFFRLTLCSKRLQTTDDESEGGANGSGTSSAPVYNVKFKRPNSEKEADAMKPFVSYLIDNRQASDKEPFPYAYPSALKYKCCLLQPSDKEVKTQREIKVCLRSLFLERVKAGNDLIPKVDESTFAGNSVTTKPGSKFVIYGSDSTDGDDFVELYHCITSE